jgi:hypothetical protein
MYGRKSSPIGTLQRLWLGASIAGLLGPPYTVNHVLPHLLSPVVKLVVAAGLPGVNGENLGWL